MRSKRKKFHLFIFVGTSVVVCFGCEPSGDHYTEIGADFQLQFDTDDSCSLLVNERNFSVPSMSTKFIPYSDSAGHHKQAQENSSNIAEGEVRCYVPIKRSKLSKLINWIKSEPKKNDISYQKMSFEINFDPTYVVSNSSFFENHQYQRYSGREDYAGVTVRFKNEHDAQVEIPGACGEVSLSSTIFKLDIESIGDSRNYTVKGQGVYVCHRRI